MVGVSKFCDSEKDMTYIGALAIGEKFEDLHDAWHDGTWEKRMEDEQFRKKVYYTYMAVASIKRLIGCTPSSVDKFACQPGTDGKKNCFFLLQFNQIILILSS